MKSKNKFYNWLVDILSKDNVVDIFKGFFFGTVNMATGTGKTSKIIIGMFSELKHYSHDRKHIFDLASPRLKLNYQTAFNVIYVLDKVKAISPKTTCIILNSSEDTSEYENVFGESGMGYSVCKLEEMSNTNFQNYLVISCYPSHGKLDDLLFNTRTYDDYVKVSYWDESHTISLKKHIKNGENYFDVKRSVKVFDKVFALDATPCKDLVEVLQVAEVKLNPDHELVDYIYQITPKQAMNDFLILPVYMFVIKGVHTDLLGNRVKHCIEAINNMKTYNSDLPRKVLINCSGTKELEYMESALRKKGYTVYSTCSNNGFSASIENENGDLVADISTINDFTNAIKNEKRDCFVLHIRQLIEGIDIDSLTGAVFFGVNSSNGFRNVVQTIGRTLRIGAGDRDENGKAKDIDSRSKKYGEVYFVSDEKNYDYELGQISGLFRTVYETGFCHFRYQNDDTKSSVGGAAKAQNWNAADDYKYSCNGEDNGTRTEGEISEFIVNVKELLVRKLPFANNDKLPKPLFDKVQSEINHALMDLTIKDCNTLEYIVDKNGLIQDAIDKLNSEATPEIKKVIEKFKLSKR